MEDFDLSLIHNNKNKNKNKKNCKLAVERGIFGWLKMVSLRLLTLLLLLLLLVVGNSEWIRIPDPLMVVYCMIKTSMSPLQFGMARLVFVWKHSVLLFLIITLKRMHFLCSAKTWFMGWCSGAWCAKMP